MNQEKKYPQAYFLTFTTYGTWLHGSSKNSVDLQHNQFLKPRLPENTHYRHISMDNMKHPPYYLNVKKRQIILSSVINTCEAHQWHLFAAHIRSNHVHILLHAEKDPLFLLTRIKADASKNLNLHDAPQQTASRWTRHGSTRYVWYDRWILPAAHYIIERQGEKMAYFINEEFKFEFDNLGDDFFKYQC